MGFFNLQACKFLNGNFYRSILEPSKTEKKLKLLTLKNSMNTEVLYLLQSNFT
jgi:hypothetical protein